MTQEERRKEKELLLNVLKDGLPYGLQLKITDIDGFTFNGELLVLSKNWCRLNITDPIKRAKVKNQTIPLNHIYIKPYLRPMSSMTEEETKELLFVRLEAKYGKSCVYITNFIKLNEVSFRKEPPYVGSVAIWFSFENKIVHDSKIRDYSKCEYLGQINDITLAEIDWLNAHHFDYRGLIPMSRAIEVTKENNPYKE